MCSDLLLLPSVSESATFDIETHAARRKVSSEFNSYDLDVETYIQSDCRITRSCDFECTLWRDLDTNGSRGLAVPRMCKLCSTGRDERRESKANAKTATHAKTVRSTKTLRRKTSSLTQAANFSVLAA